MKRFLCATAIIVFTFALKGQVAYQHVSDRGIYTFLDELATMHIIDISTTIKPYSRKQIANYLLIASESNEKLSRTQKVWLNQYLTEYAMEGDNLKEGKWPIIKRDSTLSVHFLLPEVAYRDTFFSALIRPIYGFRYFTGTNADFFTTYGGAEAISYLGKSWSVYASLRDHYQDGQRLAQPSFLTQEQGGTYKSLTLGGPGGEFSEMRGGITWSWRWGSLGIIKDHLIWGDNQNGSNIFSGRTPSFPMIKLYMNPAKWLEFNYYHGWLVSEAVDSVNSIFPVDGRPRTIQRRKYIAANMFTVKPAKHLNVSFGNSIVYGDMDVQLAYLIPFFFYKSLVHTVHWGTSFQNNALFFNVSTRQIKHLHLYATCYIDEFSIKRVVDPNRNNFIGYKGGFSLAHWPVRNVIVGSEYTFTKPITYLHDEPTTSFESNRYNLGHYLKDNAEEFFATIRIYPVSTLQFSASYTLARKGNYYEYIRGMSNPRIDELPVLEDITWESESWVFSVQVNPFPNLMVFAKFSLNDVQGYDVDERTAQQYLNMFSAPYLHGKTRVIEVGFGMGF
jgi:hypothetical protein